MKSALPTPVVLFGIITSVQSRKFSLNYTEEIEIGHVHQTKDHGAIYLECRYPCDVNDGTCYSVVITNPQMVPGDIVNELKTHYLSMPKSRI